MKKNNLQLGRKYLHRRQAVIDGVLREAERWIKCERITPTGAIFSRDFEPRIRTDITSAAVHMIRVQAEQIRRMSAEEYLKEKIGNGADGQEDT